VAAADGVHGTPYEKFRAFEIKILAPGTWNLTPGTCIRVMVRTMN